jgi:Phage integrase, N-terminal SAM-like domain
MNDSSRKVSPLRQRMIEEMRMRQLAPKTRDAYIRPVLHFTRFLGRSPDTATAEDLVVSSPGLRPSMYPYAALRGPTYRHNSHAHHTWDSSSHQIACFQAPEGRPCGFDSYRPLHFPASLRTRRHTRLGSTR